MAKGNRKIESRKASRKASRRERRFERELDSNVVHLVTDKSTLPSPKRDTRPIVARNERQQDYIDSIRERIITFCTGEAGCGKTFLSTALAAEALLAKDVERIIVTRPVLSAEEDLGYLPGDVADKFAPYFRPVYDVLKQRLGGSFLEYCLKPEIGKVEIAPFSYMRGRTFSNAFVILDEAQNVTPSQMKMFLTRLGENVTVVVNGDIAQIDLPDSIDSGLEDALDRFIPTVDIGKINFRVEDCVRSPICKAVLKVYNQ